MTEVEECCECEGRYVHDARMILLLDSGMSMRLDCGGLFYRIPDILSVEYCGPSSCSPYIYTCVMI